MKFFLFSLCFLFVFDASAAEPKKKVVKEAAEQEEFVSPSEEEKQPLPPSKESSDSERNKDEPWYFNLGLGYAWPKYDSQITASIGTLKAINGYTRVPVYADIGFYWPLQNKKTAIGVSIFGVSDGHEVNNYEIRITQSALAFSALTYLGENIGDGFFLRGDIGLGSYSASVTSPSGTTLYSGRSGGGLGTQVGIGYSIPVSPETRMALGLNYSFFAVKSEKTKNLTLNLSALF